MTCCKLNQLKRSIKNIDYYIVKNNHLYRSNEFKPQLIIYNIAINFQHD